MRRLLCPASEQGRDEIRYTVASIDPVDVLPFIEGGAGVRAAHSHTIADGERVLVWQQQPRMLVIETGDLAVCAELFHRSRSSAGPFDGDRHLDVVRDIAFSQRQ